MTQNREYAAFISYAHHPRDKAFAERLARRLEQFRLSRVMAKQFGARRLGKVYRDLDEAPAGRDLSQEITAALANSRKLVVICSPHSRQSDWVRSEAAFFVEADRASDVIPVLTAGELVDTIPTPVGEKLKWDVARLPIAADARDGELRQQEFFRVVAGLLNVPLDDVVQRLNIQSRRKFAFWAASGVGFSLAAGGAYVYTQGLSGDLNEQRYLSERAQILSESSSERAKLAAEIGSELALRLREVERRLSEQSGAASPEKSKD